MDTRAVRMFPIVLCILALSFNGMIVFSRQIDDVILNFINDTMPILFSPSRISLHLCISSDDTIKLSRKLSSLHLMHGIHNVIPDFDQKIYDDLEHQNLYVLDLDCNYATEMLRQVDMNRMFVAPMKWLFLQDRRTLIDNDDANITFTYDDSILEIFKDLAVYPDSDVVLAKRFDDDFLQLISIYRPSSQRGVIWEDRGNWTVENKIRLRTFDVASARRRNLQQTTLKSVVVMTNPDTINHLTDYKNKIIDPLSKANYIWIVHLINRMNATINFTYVNDWGQNYGNGSFGGMTGLLARREVDIPGTCMLIVEDRMHVIKYIHLQTRVRFRFVFRQPLLSSVKNIFTLPFERNVWIAIAVFLVLVFCLLYAAMKWEYYRNTMKKSSATWKQTNIGQPTFGDDLLVLLGAFAQQGYSYEPFRVSARIITLMLLVASLSLYAAYTANIVALLQSPSDSIKTLSDLLNSPLTLGAEDIQYAHYMFKTFQDPTRKAIYEERIEPKGRKSNWISMEEGVRRIKNETFAFHAMDTKIYHIMQETYQEDEKCGITDINYIHMVENHLPLPKQSPYLEIIKIGALRLQEYGLKQRDEYRLLTNKPKCMNQGSFISIGFTECHFVIVTFAYGLLLSLIIFTLELLWCKIRNKNTIKETVPTTIEKKDFEITEYID
ncbi:ionotropic receptor 75a-like [Anoplolepis gracilipes]|uniref:ionotropic receptor 75a-like n=1 Tax=Anoplolepis gracilipes TaxID=354296 RepID=UPI003B9FA2CD